MNAYTRRLAATDRMMIPFEKTSRSPRLRNCDGMNRSRARIEESRLDARPGGASGHNASLIAGKLV